MKKVFFLIFVFFLSIYHFTYFIYAEEISDYTDPKYIDKILATEPSTISKEQFYDYEFAILSGFSGSGGNYLDEPLIEWLKNAESVFKTKGIKLKDKYDRHFVFADSYLNHEQYEKASEEYRSLKCPWGIELSEWLVNNSGIKNSRVKIREYHGRIHFPAGMTAITKDRNWLFIAYFKGPIYRYDKRKRVHAIIYAPDDKYDWCDALAFNGENLVIKLRDNAGTFIFDNESCKISEFKPAD